MHAVHAKWIRFTEAEKGQVQQIFSVFLTKYFCFPHKIFSVFLTKYFLFSPQNIFLFSSQNIFCFPHNIFSATMTQYSSTVAEREHSEQKFRGEVENIVVRWLSGDTLKNITWKCGVVFGYHETDRNCRLDWRVCWKINGRINEVHQKDTISGILWYSDWPHNNTSAGNSIFVTNHNKISGGRSIM